MTKQIIVRGARRKQIDHEKMALALLMLCKDNAASANAAAHTAAPGELEHPGGGHSGGQVNSFTAPQNSPDAGGRS